MLVGTAAAACCIAAAAILGSGLLSVGSLSAASAPAESNGWQHVVSRQLAFGGILAASQTLDPPTGPPGSPSPRATLKLVQADTGTPQSLGQQLKSWSRQLAPSGTPALNAVDLIDSSHIWAVGANCTILFSADGGTWSKDTAVTGCTAGTSLNGIYVTGTGGPGWAVGSNGTILVCASACRKATAAWSALKPGSSGLPSSSLTFTSVWAADATHVYAVGGGRIWACSATCAATAVGGTGNAAWAPFTPAGLTGGNTLASVSGNGPGLTVAVGSGGTILICTTSCVTSGAGWAALTGSPVPSAGTSFTGVYASGPNDIFAVGNGAIWTCSAACNVPVSGSGAGHATWTNLVPSFSLPNLLAVAAASPDGPAWAVGKAGALWFCDAMCTESGTSWVPIVSPTPNTLRGVAVIDANTAWAVGDNGTIVAQINPGDTLNRIANGTGLLGQALNPSRWNDDYHVSLVSSSDPPVFDNTRDAVNQLMGITPSPPAWAVTDSTWLDYAMRLITTTAIADNSNCPQNPPELTAAQSELATGDDAYSNGQYGTAIDDYKQSRLDAVAADGSSCAGGITVAPTGAPAFSKLQMVPGTSGASGTITVTNTGTSAALVALYEQNVVDGGLLSGTYPVQLKIVEDGTNTLYKGPLASGWTGSGTSYLTLPGSSGNTWAVNEAHTFVFTVSWNLLAGNTYQSKTASLNFVWARS